MPIAVECPACKRNLNVPDKYAGQRVKCPACTTAVPVPAMMIIKPMKQTAAE